MVICFTINQNNQLRRVIIPAIKKNRSYKHGHRLKCETKCENAQHIIIHSLFLSELHIKVTYIYNLIKYQVIPLVYAEDKRAVAVLTLRCQSEHMALYHPPPNKCVWKANEESHIINGGGCKMSSKTSCRD